LERVETLRPETLQPARVASEGETPLQEPSFHSEGATEKKAHGQHLRCSTIRAIRRRGDDGGHFIR